MKGYVKLRRGLLEHFKVMTSSEIKIYIGLLLLANFKNAMVKITLAELTEETNVDRKILINSLRRLHSFGYVKYTPAKNQWHSNIIEIMNYNGSVKNTRLTTLPSILPTPLPMPLPSIPANDITPNNNNDLQNPNNYKEVLRSIKKRKEEEFLSLWSKYPNKVGKKAALKHYEASVKTEEDIALINKALESYLKSERVAKGFIQNASTWFLNWKDWTEYKEELCQKCKGSGIWTSTTGYENICSCPAGLRKRGKL